MLTRSYYQAKIADFLEEDLDKILEGVEFEKISGFDRLLAKLEYNALTDVGRRVSDYGVPTKILEYYESDRRPEIKTSFDEYEMTLFNRVESVLNK